MPDETFSAASLDAAVRGQIEVLSTYQQNRSQLDPVFLKLHAQMIVQIAHLMTEELEKGSPPAANP
jgi:hypothetical protein